MQKLCVHAATPKTANRVVRNRYGALALSPRLGPCDNDGAKLGKTLGMVDEVGVELLERLGLSDKSPPPPPPHAQVGIKVGLDEGIALLRKVGLLDGGSTLGSVLER